MNLNPVLAREVTQRMRGRQAWVVLLLYLATLAIILRLVYGAILDDPAFNGSDALAAASAGRAIFHWLLFFMLALVCFIVPGITAGAIAGERERQTLVSLQVTLLKPSAIVSGKLLASLAYVLLLVVATLPLVGVTFVIGGVGLAEVVAGMAMVVLTAFALAAVAVACSALFRRTQGATVTAYALTVLLVVGTFAFYGFQVVVDRQQPGRPSPTVLALNPFVATADVVRSRNLDRSLASPFIPLQDLIGQEQEFAIDARLADGPIPPELLGQMERDFVAAVARGPEPRRIAGLRVWAAATVAFGLLALAAAAVAVRRVTVPRVGAGE